MDICFDRPEKYIAVVLDHIIKFCKYKEFEYKTRWEFHSLLESSIIGTKLVGLLARLINDETPLGILCRMPSIGWKQWAKDRLMLVHGRKEGGA